MSALFHPCLCGHSAAEWLIYMKKGLILMIALLLLVISSAVSAVSAEPEPDGIDPSLTQLKIIMTVERLENGSIKALMLDSEGGYVAAWPVTLEVDGEKVEEVYSSWTGEALFEYSVPETAASVACTAASGQYDSYYFVGDTVYLGGETTQTVPPTTQSAVPVVNGEEFSNIYAPKTTTVQNGRIGVGVDIDNGALNAFQSSIAAFNEQARMWMEPSVYNAMVLSDTATVHLAISLNNNTVGKDAFIAAKNADPAFSAYGDNQVKGFVLDLALSYIESGERVEITPADGMYQIELPVPESMKSCDKIAVSVCTADGLSSLVEVKRSGGMISFTVQRFQTLAIVGFFNNSGAVTTLAQTPWLLIVIGLIGALLMVGAIVLFVFVVFRRVKVKKKMPDDGSRHILLAPTSDEKVISSSDSKTQSIDSIVMDMDDQEALSQEERERFRAKVSVDENDFDDLSIKTVSPAEQLSEQSIDLARRDDFSADKPAEEPIVKPLTVDDILRELEENEKSITREEQD